MTRFITVTSGKGGVGKTNISANLALHLASRGYSTCLFDADFGLANINVLLKIYPEYNLKDVILSDKEINDILLKNYKGIDIIPGSSGVEEMANLTPEQIAKLIKSFSNINTYDFFIIDTAAGVSQDVISFCLAASEILLVITPDPTSLTDAYALLKILSLNGFKDSVMVVINQSPNIESSKKAFSKLAVTAKKFLSIKLTPIGAITRDPHVVTSVENQKPFVSLYPNSIPSKNIKKIAANLIKKDLNPDATFKIETFWEKCLSFFSTPIKTINKKPEIRDKRAQLETLSIDKDFDENYERSLSTPDRKSGAQNENELDVPMQPTTEKLIQQTNMMLNKVVESISAVTTELKSIRGLIEETKEKSTIINVQKEVDINGEEISDKNVIDELTRHLTSYSMFQALEDFEIKDIVSRLKIKEYEKDEEVLRKGDPGKNLFIVVTGKAEVVDDHGTVLDTLKHEDVFGEMSLISGDPVNATIRVTEKIQLLYLNGKDFIHVLHKYPPLQMYFARLLSKRLAGRLQKADTAKSEFLESGLTGKLSENPIPELLQMLNMGQKTGQLNFQLPKGKASISFNKGNLVHAEYNDQSDQEAFFEILTEKEGHFTYSNGLPPDHDSKPQIGHFMRMLIEGLSIIDEKNAEKN